MKSGQNLKKSTTFAKNAAHDEPLLPNYAYLCCIKNVLNGKRGGVR